jgi:hypothetical protein
MDDFKIFSDKTLDDDTVQVQGDENHKNTNIMK